MPHRRYAPPPICPIEPTGHDDPPPPQHAACGHCAGYITAGQRVDLCPTHGWVCEDCVTDITRHPVTRRIVTQ